MRFAALVALAGLALVGAAVACSGDSGQSKGASAAHQGDRDGISVVTTSNIAADWVSRVGGDRVEVTSLLPTGTSPHGYSPGARDVARVAEADIVFTMGLGLETGWLKDLVAEASEGADIVELGSFADPLPARGRDVGETGDAGEAERGVMDPHFWLDPVRVVLAVHEIARRLESADPGGAATFRGNAEAYVAELEALHVWAAGRVEALPADRRKLVTSHDSLGYLADRYGFEIVGATIPGVSTDRETTPQELAALIEAVVMQGVAAIFAETVESNRLVEQLARETGVTMVAGLFTGSLGGPGSGAETYIEMMRTDVGLIVDALSGDAPGR
jgi:zinc/manganese transport system substrate-binding protein